jgi:hypothetical protein
METDGIQPQTVGNDLAHLGAVMAVARPGWGYGVDPMAIPDARRVLKNGRRYAQQRARPPADNG